VSSVHDLNREELAEMSMVDIVYTLLKEGNKEPKPFQDLVAEVVKLKGISEKNKLDAMSRLYTEINIDGRFKGVGDNVWGLRSWYPVDQAEEIVITELKKKPKKKKKKAVDEDDEYLDDDLEGLDDDDEIDDVDDLDDDLDEDDDEEDEDIDDLDDDVEDLDEDLDESFDDDDEEQDLEDQDEDLDESDGDEKPKS
jgi:DNA-directed RNA polymerase subunit delta